MAHSEMSTSSVGWWLAVNSLLTLVICYVLSTSLSILDKYASGNHDGNEGRLFQMVGAQHKNRQAAIFVDEDCVDSRSDVDVLRSSTSDLLSTVFIDKLCCSSVLMLCPYPLEQSSFICMHCWQFHYFSVSAQDLHVCKTRVAGPCLWYPYQVFRALQIHYLLIYLWSVLQLPSLLRAIPKHSSLVNLTMSLISISL